MSADLNNMSWRIRPEELLLEIGKPFSSKINLHQAIAEVNTDESNEENIIKINSVFTEFWIGAAYSSWIAIQLRILTSNYGIHHRWNL